MIFSKKLYLFMAWVAALAFAHPLRAQESNFSMYQYTPFLTNPGSIGMVEDVRIFMNYRNQSVSAGENFQTSMLSGYFPVNIGQHRLGMGATFISDKSSDFVKSNGGMMGLAYSIPLFPGSELSLGFQGGFFQRNIDIDFTTDNQFIDGSFNPDAGTGEPVVNDSKGYLTASTGLYWQLKDKAGKFRGFAEASIFNFNQPNTSFISEGTDKLPLSWKATAGWRAYQHMKFSVMPTLRWVRQADNGFVNAGTWFRYEMNKESAQELGLGLWYNTNKAGVVSLEYNQANLTLAASYDVPVSSALNTALQTGVFEIALSLWVKKKARVYPVAETTPVPPATPVAPAVAAKEEKLPEQKIELVAEPTPARSKSGTVDRLDGRQLNDGNSNLSAQQTKMKLAQQDRLQLEKTVEFDFQTSALSPESQKFLDDIAGIMKQNTWFKIELTGHTCNIGSEQDNARLSAKRANEVQGYLTARGVAPSRIIVKGEGELHPIADNSTEEGRSLNRRVSFKVIED